MAKKNTNEPKIHEVQPLLDSESDLSDPDVRDRDAEIAKSDLVTSPFPTEFDRDSGAMPADRTGIPTDPNAAGAPDRHATDGSELASDGAENPALETLISHSKDESDLETLAEVCQDAAEGSAPPAGKPQKQKKPESNKRKWAKRILLIAVFVFTFYAMYLMTASLSGGEVVSLGSIMASTDMRFFVSAVALAMFLFFFDAFKYAILSRMTVGKYHYGTSFTTGVIGKFYDNITPFATGGQPFQMVHLAKKDYPTGVATAIPSLKYIIQLYVYILVSIVLYIINPDALNYLDPTSRGVIQTACYIGLVFAVSAPSLFVFFALAPKTADKVVSFLIRALCKIKLIKNFDATHEKVLNFVTGYQIAFKQISKKRMGLLFLVLVCIIDCLLYFALPYFLLVGMGGTPPKWKLMLDVATLNSYSFFAASLVPTPGNSGAIEASYSMVFAPVAVSTGTLFWIVFIWRFLTYYSYIFVGLIYNFYFFIKNKIRAKKEKM